MNAIIGYYSTKFGELWQMSLDDLINEAVTQVLKKTKVEKDQIDAIFFGNMLGGVVEENLLIAAHIAEKLEVNIPIYPVEAACASGGLAFQMANGYLKSNSNKTIIVLGAEKMTDISAENITKALSCAASSEEQAVGLTFPGVYGMIANLYLQKYHYTEEHLAAISVKNHAHGVFNENAHFRKYVTVDDVLESPYVAYPLKVLDSSPISDGAAALVLTNKKSEIGNRKSSYIMSSEVATDCVSIAKRERLDELKATKIAGEKAFKTANLKRKDIRVMEVHDCFSIAEILALEDLGFWKKGEGGDQAKAMSTAATSGGNLIVNTSGGLKAAGHPVGGTGIKQIGEVHLQLTGQAGERQVKNAKYGMAHNVGGSGGLTVVSILGS